MEGLTSGVSGPLSARRTISFNALVTTPARVTRSLREVVSKGGFFGANDASSSVES